MSVSPQAPGFSLFSARLKIAGVGGQAEHLLSKHESP
jgi:hypothetical protein